MWILFHLFWVVGHQSVCPEKNLAHRQRWWRLDPVVNTITLDTSFQQIYFTLFSLYIFHSRFIWGRPHVLCQLHCAEVGKYTDKGTFTAAGLLEWITLVISPGWIFPKEERSHKHGANIKPLDPRHSSLSKGRLNLRPQYGKYER